MWCLTSPTELPHFFSRRVNRWEDLTHMELGFIHICICEIFKIEFHIFIIWIWKLKYVIFIIVIFVKLLSFPFLSSLHRLDNCHWPNHHHLPPSHSPYPLFLTHSQSHHHSPHLNHLEQPLHLLYFYLCICWSLLQCCHLQNSVPQCSDLAQCNAHIRTTILLLLSSSLHRTDNSR